MNRSSEFDLRRGGDPPISPESGVDSGGSGYREAGRGGRELQASEHPVARAVVTSATERGLSVPRATEFEAIPGYGVHGRVDGRLLGVGGPNLLEQRAISLPAGLSEFTESAAAQGQGVVYLVADSQVLAAFAVADAIRPESSNCRARRHHDAHSPPNP